MGATPKRGLGVRALGHPQASLEGGTRARQCTILNVQGSVRHGSRLCSLTCKEQGKEVVETQNAGLGREGSMRNVHYYGGTRPPYIRRANSVASAFCPARCGGHDGAWPSTNQGEAIHCFCKGQ